MGKECRIRYVGGKQKRSSPDQENEWKQVASGGGENLQKAQETWDTKGSQDSMAVTLAKIAQQWVGGT